MKLVRDVNLHSSVFYILARQDVDIVESWLEGLTPGLERITNEDIAIEMIELYVQ